MQKQQKKRPYEDEVAAGIVLLNKKKRKWREKIGDPKELEMHLPWQCVLGKVYGTYEHGASLLFGDFTDEPIRYGFHLDFEKIFFSSTDRTEAVVMRTKKEYSTLKREWVRQLREYDHATEA